MIEIGQLLYLTMSIVATSNTAFAKGDAITPENLWMTPILEVCRKKLVMTNLIVLARDEGISQSAAIERVRTLSLTFPAQGYGLALDIYRHEKLDAGDWGPIHRT